MLEAASRGELDNPEAVIESLMPAADAFEADAREQLRALHSRLAEQQAAHEAERERWADEKARLIRQCQRAERDLVAISGCPQNGPLEDPHGFYVYYLWDHLQRILYIGRSANIFRRLGEHVLKRGIGIYRITTVQCPDAATMERLEMQAIAEHQPEWNVQGVSA
ncbi:GIY-YIG nuclease family protein [Nonomuraea typhae]|uniref:GIY-YIG nuclease family protein n=1 Tax=Nonomuraea typhae TaxID=2603600 RepID=UPI0012F715AE|nr:GIY-YIG nuclease family protein [Nonomuraea typhae]